MVVEADMYDGDSVGPHAPKRVTGRAAADAHLLRRGAQTVLEAVPIWGKHYIIPRWEKFRAHAVRLQPGDAVAALADARLIQAMTLTLLEAGEKITNPPMIATQEAVRSDIDIAPGG
jgi:hypothetical protein